MGFFGVIPPLVLTVCDTTLLMAYIVATYETYADSEIVEGYQSV